MEGREPQRSNDLFFVCSLVEYIARQTKNHASVVVNALGREKLQHLLDLADVYHCENIEKLSHVLIEKHAIATGHYDGVARCSYAVPTFWDIGKVYKRLILDVAHERNTDDFIGIMTEVFNSWLSRKIEDFNCSMYYENPSYLFHCYKAGDVL